MLAVLAVLLLIFFSTQFVRILAEVAAGVLPGKLVFTLMGLQSIKSLAEILPIALFFGILLSFGRMYRDHEMVALGTCGFGQTSLARIVMIIAPLVAVIVAICSLYISPWAARTAAELEHEYQHGSELSGITAGQFSESRDGNFIMYVESIDDDRQTMRNVFVHSRGSDKKTVLFSATGQRHVDESSGDEYMLMKDGYRYEGEPGQANYRIVKFGTHAIRVESKASGPKNLARKEMHSTKLWESNSRYLSAELQRRLVLPLSAIVLALVAVPLSRSRPREGRYARLFSAVLIYIIYNNLLGASLGWVSSGKLPSFIGIWWVPMLLLVYGGLMSAWQSRGQMPRLQAMLSGGKTT